jgi:hypothetical protein
MKTVEQVLKEIQPEWQVRKGIKVHTVKQIHEAMEAFGKQLVLAYIEELKGVTEYALEIEKGTRELGLEPVIVEENEK